MLERLVIRNYAIIHALDISFNDGLTVITGETGAGKSILLGALGLAWGKELITKCCPMIPANVLLKLILNWLMTT